ncbi:uncharacterized protein [Rutidosis leptorrhynchoides]|uniref:uncharacterized protein n=1 Tax=Rutidosis leptorrhynchoides TaxID=125765 RepID=UPI003A997F41
MQKEKGILDFFKKPDPKRQKVETPPSVENPSSSAPPIPKSQATNVNNSFDINSLVRDPGVQQQIWKYDFNKQDEVRRAYIRAGPFQCILAEYPKIGKEHRRSFQAKWYKEFPTWLEYSPTKDAVFCLPYFLFHQENGPSGTNAFTVDGFRNWKNWKEAFPAHTGKDHTSRHRIAESKLSDLMNQSAHLRRRYEKHASHKDKETRVRVKAAVHAVRWLAFQGCAFRGHDERKESKRQGNFQALLNLLSTYNEDVSTSIANAPQNAIYNSPKIQKQILHTMSRRVKEVIREEIGDAKYCILVDEARDESKKKNKYTAASILRDEIRFVLSQHNLDVQNIRGQGYDGASNMRGEFNGLQALILNICPYAHYVHCMAHRLQLALVAASKEVILIHYDQLKAAHAENIAHLLAMDELESGTWLNQVCNLQRAGDTRWSSHLRSVCSLINMFSAICEILMIIFDDGATSTQRADADTTYEVLTSYEFVFTLHLVMKVLEITDFILVPNLDEHYIARRGRARHQQEDITMEHHYKVDIFNALVDTQLHELNSKFNDHAMELLTLSSALDPKEMQSPDFQELSPISDLCKWMFALKTSLEVFMINLSVNGLKQCGGNDPRIDSRFFSEEMEFSAEKDESAHHQKKKGLTVSVGNVGGHVRFPQAEFRLRLSSTRRASTLTELLLHLRWELRFDFQECYLELWVEILGGPIKMEIKATNKQQVNEAFRRIGDVLDPWLHNSSKVMQKYALKVKSTRWKMEELL